MASLEHDKETNENRVLELRLRWGLELSLSFSFASCFWLPNCETMSSFVILTLYSQTAGEKTYQEWCKTLNKLGNGFSSMVSILFNTGLYKSAFSI